MKKTLLTLILFSTFATQVLQAETIRIDVGSQSPELQTIDRPKAGMNMDEVEEKFGAPLSQSSVGSPAITTWEYEYFSVYFEGSTVLHSVLIKTKP